MNTKLLFILIILILLQGCFATTDVHEVKPQAIYNTYKYIENKPQELHELYLNYYLDEERNKVLNLMNLGLYAFQNNYKEDAKFAFDKIIKHFNSINSENDSTKKAKSLWHSEDKKNFIGEPYERSMVYFYRGLLYLDDDDFENARASFKSGLIEDSRSEDEEYQADFKSLLLLDALSSKLNNDPILFNDSLNELEEIVRTENNIEEISVPCIHEYSYCRSSNDPTVYIQTNIEYSLVKGPIVIRQNPDIKAKVIASLNGGEVITFDSIKDDWSKTNSGWVKTEDVINNLQLTKLLKFDGITEAIKNSNVFILVDVGSGPSKYTSGENNSELKFQDNDYSNFPEIVSMNIESKALLLDNLFFQASTRGGRAVDAIIEGKVTWKDEKMEMADKFYETGKDSFEAAAKFYNQQGYTGNAQQDAATAMVTLGVMAFSAISAGIGKVTESIAESVVTTADSRYWAILPGKIYFYMAKLKPGNHKIQIKTEESTTINLNVPEDKIVVKHLISERIKPEGFINKAQLNQILSEKSKYHSQYLESINKGDKNDSPTNGIKNFFSNFKFGS